MSTHLEPEEILRLLDGTLAGPGATLAAGHLESCAACQGRAAAVRGLASQVASVLPRLDAAEGPMPSAALRSRLDDAVRRTVAAGTGVPDAPPIPGRSDTPATPYRRRWLLGIGTLAAAASILVILHQPSQEIGPGFSARLEVERPAGAVRGDGASTWHLELTLEEATHLLVLTVSAGRIERRFPHPNRVLGTFGLPSPLPRSETLRLPPDFLMDWPAPETGATALVIPSDAEWTTAAVNGVLVELAPLAESAPEGSRASALLERLRAKWPKALALDFPR